MRVIATQAGTWGKGKNLKRIREGQEFDVPEGTKGKWFVPAAPVEMPKADAKPAKPAKAGKADAADLT